MDKRNHKIKSDYGIKDYFKFYKNKYNLDIDKKKYKEVLKDFHEELKELIIEESLIFQMPYIRMEIIIKKERKRPRIVDGKLINTTPPDWQATKALWERDADAKEKKIIVRYNNYHTSGYVFRIYCKKFRCNLKYRSLYKFNPNREFQRALAKRLKDTDKDPLDAFLLY